LQVVLIQFSVQFEERMPELFHCSSEFAAQLGHLVAEPRHFRNALFDGLPRGCITLVKIAVL